MSFELWLEGGLRPRLVVVDVDAPREASLLPWLVRWSVPVPETDDRGLPTLAAARALAPQDLLADEAASEGGGRLVGRVTHEGQRTFFAWFPDRASAAAFVEASLLGSLSPVEDRAWRQFARRLAPPLSWWVGLLEKGEGVWSLVGLARRPERLVTLEGLGRWRWGPEGVSTLEREPDHPPDRELAEALGGAGWELLWVERGQKASDALEEE